MLARKLKKPSRLCSGVELLSGESGGEKNQPPTFRMIYNPFRFVNPGFADWGQ
jgi:hypothetical protein